jgi:hypothetical protein
MHDRFLFIHKMVQTGSLVAMGFAIALVVRTDQQLLSMRGSRITPFHKTESILQITTVGIVATALLYALHLIVGAYIDEAYRNLEPSDEEVRLSKE